MTRIDTGAANGAGQPLCHMSRAMADTDGAAWMWARSGPTARPTPSPRPTSMPAGCGTAPRVAATDPNGTTLVSDISDDGIDANGDDNTDPGPPITPGPGAGGDQVGRHRRNHGRGRGRAPDRGPPIAAMSTINRCDPVTDDLIPRPAATGTALTLRPRRPQRVAPGAGDTILSPGDTWAWGVAPQAHPGGCRCRRAVEPGHRRRAGALWHAGQRCLVRRRSGRRQPAAGSDRDGDPRDTRPRPGQDHGQRADHGRGCGQLRHHRDQLPAMSACPAWP